MAHGVIADHAYSDRHRDFDRDRLARRDGRAGRRLTGFVVAIFFLVAARLYAFAYSAEPVALLWIDALHFLLICPVAGAIIAGWPRPKAPAAT